MRFGFLETPGDGRKAERVTVQPKASGMIPDMIPLYDAEQFEGLIQRERARADRAAARPRREAPKRVEPKKGPEGKQVDGVWGATTDNREFSLVVFRPRTRADRTGLVELLQSSVRTTDAVGIIDNRRLGVLLPDTAAENAVFFVKKVLTGAETAGVQLSHVVHTYPHQWPEDGDPSWNEPRRAETPGSPEPTTERPEKADRRHSETPVKRSTGWSFVGWLQNAAARRASHKVVRA